MALEHKTVVGGIQIERDGRAVILLKLGVVDGVQEYAGTTHRLYFEKGEAIAPKIQDTNTTLTSKGLAPIPNKAANVINSTITACWAAMDA